MLVSGRVKQGQALPMWISDIFVAHLFHILLIDEIWLNQFEMDNISCSHMFVGFHVLQIGAGFL